VDIHEYQAKYLLKRYNISVPEGKVAQSSEKAQTVAQGLRAKSFAIKAQIHAGGRGKAGGVKLARSPEEVKSAADEILNRVLVTPQTGPQGKQVRKVLIEQAVEIDREFYLGLLVDRGNANVTMIASSAGGMDIEEASKTAPEKIMRVHIDPNIGLQPFQTKKIHYHLKLPAKLLRKSTDLMTSLYQLFSELDCMLVEINPLVLTKRQKLIALDAKINFDDNALFRHPEIEDLRDDLEDDPTEVQAQKIGMSFVHLDGNIGCLVNGAGLAMTTLDVIKLKGGKPANFLDIGGRADSEGVTKALELIMAGKDIRAILVNIFGGITHCDMIAEAVIEAIKETGVRTPIVIRLAGTNYKKGRQMIRDACIQAEAVDTLSEAAEKVVALAQEN